MRYARNMMVAAVAATGMLGMTGAAQALSVNYEIGTGSSVVANSSDPGLVIHTQLDNALAGLTFSLDVGESYTFDFFDIWTTETSVNGDDKQPHAVLATLDFLNPNVQAPVEGETIGVSEIFGIVQYGQITWNGPVEVTGFGDGANSTFRVELSSANFNEGLFGLWPEWCWGTTVTATVTHLSSETPTSPIPTPSAAAGGLFMAGLGLLRRWRRDSLA